MTTRAKFNCVSVTAMPDSKSVLLVPVIGGSEENKSFWKYTPSGRLELNILNENVAFVPGKEYYVDISEAAPAK